MCEGTGCSLRESCYRHTAAPSQWNQSYYLHSPLEEDGTCTQYWEVKE
jgi:hypothetical protein